MPLPAKPAKQFIPKNGKQKSQTQTGVSPPTVQVQVRPSQGQHKRNEATHRKGATRGNQKIKEVTESIARTEEELRGDRDALRESIRQGEELAGKLDAATKEVAELRSVVEAEEKRLDDRDSEIVEQCLEKARQGYRWSPMDKTATDWTYGSILALGFSIFMIMFIYRESNLSDVGLGIILYFSFGFICILMSFGVSKKLYRFRYEYHFVRMVDRGTNKDLRDDVHSQGELKHKPMLAEFNFVDNHIRKQYEKQGITSNYEWSRTLIVSLELLSQVMTGDAASLRLSSDDSWKKIYARAASMQSINLNRYESLGVTNIVQDTCIVAHALCMMQQERRNILPFPRPLP